MPILETVASLSLVKDVGVPLLVEIAGKWLGDKAPEWLALYRNHDIPAALGKAWTIALKAVADDYLKQHRDSITHSTTDDIRGLVADLSKKPVITKLFPTDVPNDPLSQLNTKSVVAIASRKDDVQAMLDQVIAAVAAERTTCHYPQSFFAFIHERLATVLFYYFVEIAVKENEKANKQIAFEHAIDTFWRLWRIEEAIVLQGKKLDGITKNTDLLPAIKDQLDEMKDQLLDELLDRKRQEQAQKSDSTGGPPEFTEEERSIAKAALNSANALTRAKAAIVEGQPAQARKELEAAEKVLQDAFDYCTTMGDSYYFEGAYDRAIPWFEKALAMPGRDRDARARNNLALALQSSQIADAEPLLERAISLHRGTLALQNASSLGWAMTQNSLGNALAIMGERESTTARLEEAVTAYQEALKECSRGRVPLQWAMTQNNLGNALTSLGEREDGTARLKEAVSAYREALKECTRERGPRQWAMTQNNLGNALLRLGERENGTERLEEAGVAYREALKENTREGVPLGWAMTQNNLGNALQTLGEREGGTGRLEESVAAYREALKEYTRERVPLDWALTQNNLGNALAILGGRESGTRRLEESVAAYREALKEGIRERVPWRWAMTQNNLGNALQMLGERESGTTWLTEAIAAYRAALEEFKAPEASYYDTKTKKNLGRAEALLAERRRAGE